MKYQHTILSRTSQQGAVLITALMLLVILTILGITSMSTTTMEERMAANSQEINRAFQAASTGLEIVFNDGKAFDTRNTVDSNHTASDTYSDSTDHQVMKIQVRKEQYPEQQLKLPEKMVDLDNERRFFWLIRYACS